MPDLRVGVVYDCLFPISTGGGERVYRRLAELLVERGTRVSYLTRLQWQADAEPPTAFALVPVWHGEIYDRAGIRTTTGALSFAFAVYRNLRSHRDEYDLVVASALPVLTLLATRWALRGTSVWVVADWLEIWPPVKWVKYAGVLAGAVAVVLQAIGARSADLHTVNSSFTASRLSRVNRDASSVVLGLVDLVGTPANPGATPAEPGSPPFALFAGRHIADKHIDVLPAALVFARATIPTLRLVVVGIGPETGTLIDEVDRLGVGEFVDVLGRVDDETLSDLMAGAAVMVNPSSREGFGLVVAEAAAVGTPSVVVAGSDNAAVDLIVDGVNGFVSPSRGPADLGAALVMVVQGSRALRNNTRAWFETERVARSLGVAVDEILDRYRSRAS